MVSMSMHVDASTVVCPYCSAKRKEQCTRARSRTRPGDEPDIESGAFFHAERVKLAGKAAPHLEHGRGDAESGPDDSDCTCRGTSEEAICAVAGCGFCIAAQNMAKAMVRGFAEAMKR